jgi:hypothetical protein
MNTQNAHNLSAVNALAYHVTGAIERGESTAIVEQRVIGHKYNVEFTDTFNGEANYSWVIRAVVEMPELTHYGYDGCTNYYRTNKVFERELMRKAKAAVGATGSRGVKSVMGDDIQFKLYGSNNVMFISYAE